MGIVSSKYEDYLHILLGLFFLVFGISLVMIKIDVKSFFSRTGLPFFFFFFFLICVICLSQASWVMRLKQKFVHCVLSF